MIEELKSEEKGRLNYWALACWLIYSVILMKFIVFDSWGTIAAGIGDLPIDGFKVRVLSALPYLGISVLVWNWRKMGAKGFSLLVVLIGCMVLIGFVSHLYLQRLHHQNPIVIPNQTAIRFTLASGIFLGMIVVLFLMRRRNSEMDSE
jgi:hypothetical protein